MEQLTLEQRANNYTIDIFEREQQYAHSIGNLLKTAFKDGAEWQKEQYKELINLSRQLLGAYDVRYPDAKQLLVGYTNEEAFTKFNTLLERLQPSK